MNTEEELIKHFKDDAENFKKINESFTHQQEAHVEFNKKLDQILSHVEKSKDFMENLSGLNDFVKGTRLLKSPMMWVVGFIIGAVALMGGFKTILNWFLIK